MRGEESVSQLRSHHHSYSQEELGKILIETIRDYLSNKIELYELIEISETIRRYHMHECSKQVIQAVTTLHILREDLHNPSTSDLPEQKIRNNIDDLLTGLTG